jgi:mxaK protein
MMRKLRLWPAAIALAAGLGLAAEGGARWWRTQADNTRIAALLAGKDAAVDQDAGAPLLAARARYKMSHGDIDGAQAIADRLAATAPEALRANLLYALGNAALRHGLEILPKTPFRLVRPVLAQARSAYRLALQLDPQDWDARYNYALVAALLRDTEHASPTSGDEMAHERAAWPDIPGAPNGMP